MKMLKRFAIAVVLVVGVALLAVNLVAASGNTTAKGIVKFPSMMAGFTAKMTCSCAFIAGLDDDHCTDMARQSPPIASSVIDRANKTVKSTSAFFWSRTARYVGPDEGCALE